MGKLKGLVLKSPFLKRKALRYAFKYKQPSWKALLEKDGALWGSALKNRAEGKRILVATSVGMHLAGTVLESALSIALTMRGAEVDVLLCDEQLPACLGCIYTLFPSPREIAEYGPSKSLCKYCFKPAAEMYGALGLRLLKYSDFLTAEEIQKARDISSAVPLHKIGSYTFNGVSVGEHALAGALRFYALGSLEGEQHGEKILRRYLDASLLTTFAVENLLKDTAYECAVFHHGIYVPQGIIGEVCRRRKTRVVNWNPGYKKNTFIFSHHDTYHHTMISEPVEKWSDIEWNMKKEQELESYLKSRWTGAQDWIWFHNSPEFELEKMSRETGIDFSKPCIGALTSVVWDAQLHYKSNAFPNMLDWVIKTVEYFLRRPELQLIIRVHPAEIHGALPSRQKMADEVRRVFPVLPPNVFIIPPESSASTYLLMSQCDSVIIYNTKTGIELAAAGMPVIVAGEAWIKNKGFSIDADSPFAYFNILDRLPLKERMSPEDTLKAKKYAYHFFFRRMIPLKFMAPTGSFPPYELDITGLDALLPGRSAGLDVICDGILKGTDFMHKRIA